ncbi:MAG: chorismate mutase [Gemmatimonadota bacterium]|nr:chorismate mutase [Gemmatimonadota bacterium]
MAEDRAALDRLRDRIHRLDRELVTLIAERRSLVLEIGGLKESLGLPVLDPPQEAKVVRRAAQIAREAGTDEELVRDVLWRIIASARSEQEGRTQWGPPPTPTD